MKIFCNIIIVFSVTFELCNASLLNKIIILFSIFIFKSYLLQTFEWYHRLHKNIKQRNCCHYC